jgi:hypothetical protein
MRKLWNSVCGFSNKRKNITMGLFQYFINDTLGKWRLVLMAFDQL